ncbi:MAG: Response regulator UvrY [Pseudomonadota bacterium]
MDVCIIHAYPMVQELLTHWVQEHDPNLNVVCMSRPPQAEAQDMAVMGPRLVVLDDDTLPMQSALPLQRLRQAHPRATLLMLINPSPAMLGRRWLQAGADELLLKTLPVDDIRRRLVAALESRTTNWPSGIRRPLPALQAAADNMPRLTRRHVRLLQLLDQGLSTQDMAHSLGLQPNTIRSHLYRLFKRIGARTRVQALHIARQRGWL